MKRRPIPILFASAIGALGALVPIATSSGVRAASTAADGSPAAAIVAERVPAAAGDAGGSGGAAVLDVEAEAVLLVTTTTDGGAGSLRHAIETLAISDGGDTVVLAAGATYVLTCAAGGDLEHGDTPLEIDGQGATVTMDASCEEGILDNGSGALVIRDVVFTGLELTPADALTAIVETGGPFTLLGGRVADNTVDSGTAALDGFFFKRNDSPGDVVVEGTVFERNTRTTGADCGLFCVVGDLSFRGVQFDDTNVDTASGCGGILCITGDARFVDSSVNTTTNGGTSHCGGIVCMDGDLAFVRTTITGTDSSVEAPGTICGGIACTTNGFAMTDSSITDTVVTDDVDDVCGAILCTAGGDLRLERSTLAATSATLSGDQGGNACAAMVCGVDVLRAVNSTIADNVTTGGASLAGAFAAGDAIRFVYVTFVGNTGSNLPALASQSDDPVPFSTFASVLSQAGPGRTCATDVDVTSNGFNFADDTTCGLTGTGDLQMSGANPMLRPLADNGGPGPTMEPLMMSPLVDRVPATACQSDGAAEITTDERGLPRPSGGGPNCDVGAVELQSSPVVGPVPNFTG